MKLRPSKKLATVTRCSYCHSDDGKTKACILCGTLTHEECVEENGGCPTLGCAKPVKVETWTGPVAVPVPWTARREALYDTEAWPTTAAPTIFQNYNNFAVATNTTQPYYLNSYLDGILTRAAPVHNEFLDEDADSTDTTEPF